VPEPDGSEAGGPGPGGAETAPAVEPPPAPRPALDEPRPPRPVRVKRVEPAPDRREETSADDEKLPEDEGGPRQRAEPAAPLQDSGQDEAIFVP
jgi:hypothetical protein